MKKLKILCGLQMLITVVYAQTPNHPQTYSYPLYQQFNSVVFNPEVRLHSALKPYFIDDSALAVRANFLLNSSTDSNRKSWLGRKFFQEHLLEIKKRDYWVYGDFLPDFLWGRGMAGNNISWLNTRGYQLGGTIGDKFSFYTSGYENQGRFAPYYQQYVDSMKVVSGQSYDRTFGRKDIKDWSYVSALISYTPVKYLNISLGQDKTFIGDGYRSLILSDYASNYPFLRLTAHLGNVQYMAMWAAMQDPSARQLSYDAGYRKKGGVFHYLDWNVNKRLSLGFFDSVIWMQYDDDGNKRGFDWSYANPLIFLRPMEGMSGSPDNVMIGFTGKYKLPGHAFYGQIALDEFTASEFFKNKGYWANKYSFQLGFRGYDFFKVKNLNYLFEFNSARPYMYTEKSAIINYAHYNEPLAHPLGANFKELLSIWNYSWQRWQFSVQGIVARYGLDADSENFGKDIFKSYLSRFSNYGHHTGQGLSTNLVYLEGTISCLLNPKTNLRVEAGLLHRRESNLLSTDQTNWFTLGLRSSFRNLYHDF